MKTATEIIGILRDAKPELERKYRVRQLALFGSYARGDQREESDVDILVEVDPSIGLDFVTLAEELETALDARVDLVSTRALKPRIRTFIQPQLIYV